MPSTSTRTMTIAIAAFIPWLLAIAGLTAAMELPRSLFIPVHYLLDMLLFGVAFGWYFKGHMDEHPFSVMAEAILFLTFYEIIYLLFIHEGDFWFLTYLDWIVPAFLIASTIYGVGTVITKKA